MLVAAFSLLWCCSSGGGRWLAGGWTCCCWAAGWWWWSEVENCCGESRVCGWPAGWAGTTTDIGTICKTNRVFWDVYQKTAQIQLQYVYTTHTQTQTHTHTHTHTQTQWRQCFRVIISYIAGDRPASRQGIGGFCWCRASWLGTGRSSRPHRTP